MSRKPLSPWGELALEAFVTGLCMAAGEALVTETVRALRRWRKRKAKAGAPDQPPGIAT